MLLEILMNAMLYTAMHVSNLLMNKLVPNVLLQMRVLRHISKQTCLRGYVKAVKRLCLTCTSSSQ